MSQPKLTLRPPPNVDFVQGYPGIPPGGPDRPQAAVKGAIEVRVGQQGVKAKWVRIELRKIETLPGGGVANTFFDFVGQSPINLWQSPDDQYSTLHTNDFPFFIRIPESIPPTIALEKGAGIKYELIASVCVQGKKGFLRRDKPTVTATASVITIDKHELHSTWPIYLQPETRSHSQDGVTLVVERSHTCYGPGDRVVVMATVKSDTLHTVLLRGFEFMLRETTIFRAAPHTQGKKGSPQVKVSSIGEQKVPVNATLYGGTQHKAELSITVPPHHTSATINAARHIDINYVLTVKALMNTGQPVIMDLPVMISNWPRAVSAEAMRRIGHAFNVSLPGHPNGQTGSGQQFPAALMGNRATATPAAPAVSPSAPSSATPSHTHSSSIDKKSSISDLRSPTKPALGPYNTVPPNSDKTNYGYGSTNEFGERERKKTAEGTPVTFAAQTIGATGYGASRTRAGSGASNDVPVAAVRPRSSGGRTSNPTSRLTLVNTTEEELREIEAEAERAARRQPSTILESPVALEPSAQLSQTQAAPNQQRTTTPKTTTAAQKWISAAKEKEILYQRAVESVNRVQGTRISVDQSSQNGHGDAQSIKSATTPASAVSKPEKRWPSAEEEKAQARRFEEAKAAVVRARGQEAFEAASGSALSAAPVASGSARSPALSPGATIYSEAMAAINRPVTAGSTHSTGSVTSPYHSQPSQPVVTPTTPASTYGRDSSSGALPSAAEEKAMMARYYEAKTAVWQTQSAHYGRVPGNAGPDPVPYDALYPGQQAISPVSQVQPYPVSSLSVQPPPAGMPPAFVASGSSQHPILSEKERLRRHYEAQDAVAAQAQQPPPQWQPAPPPPQDYASSPPPGPYPELSPAGNPPPFSAPQTPLSAYAEKEMLRRKYEQQDAAAQGTPLPTPTPPPRTSQMINGSGGRGRPPPTPPISPNVMPGTPSSARPLTAAEEKARLKAMYEAEDRTAGARPPIPTQSPYPSPPPSNGYHDPTAVPRTTPSPQLPISAIPPPPPLAPKPPKEYIEETQQVDIRTTAKLQAIDAGELDPELASLAPSDHEAADVEETDARDNTFGPGTLSAAANPSSPGPTSTGFAPGLSRQSSFAPSVGGGPSRQTSLVAAPGTPRTVPPPPPLPPKVLIE
ncbi:hypothetical protein BD309DRAFT_501585 [Dichomitus squalens]|uniref:Arrestin C-terminal-like domain-containing protein n=1 Tax=Dichomitus squalens TaxID=114155 RepID=A0A4V2K639_9APHY|nr:hypothetical protein BD309DRAFT_501585 [Dichomitus squalens]TBU65444.1 hypothetical protein BD310DRAFT_971564 [Dichomitus squalens]